MVSAPYTVELNDVVISTVQHHTSDELLRRGRDQLDQLDQLYKEGTTLPRVMVKSLHPYLTRVAHRIRYLEALYNYILSHEDVVMCTGEEILDIYNNQSALL